MSYTFDLMGVAPVLTFFNYQQTVELDFGQKEAVRERPFANH